MCVVFEVFVCLGDGFEWVSRSDVGAEVSGDKRFGECCGGCGLDCRGEVVATEMAEGDVFESESPVRDAGTVCGRGVGADRPADGEDVGVEVDVRAEVDVGGAVRCTPFGAT